MSETWLEEVVAAFWRAAGGPAPFPRDLEVPVLWALPLVVHRLPRLRVSGVQAWLRRTGTLVRVTQPDRPLRGCLIAYGGKGAVLLDGDDPEDERRFSLAHEIGHFLVDYLAPRQRVVERLGAEAADVLDGLRPPTLDERVSALLTGVTLGVHTHLLQRSHDGSIGCGRVMAAESRADRLALELLAPATSVRGALGRHAPPGRPDDPADRTTDLLVERFALPPAVAVPYARWLCRRWYGEPSVREWLGI